MRLLVVIPFHAGDQKLLLNLLKWIQELGMLDNDCALVFSKNTKRDLIHEVVAEASLCFRNVSQVTTPHSLGDESWPKGPNWLFETAAKHIEGRKLGPWLWMEPDCVPMCQGWLRILEQAYEKYGTPFLGPRLDPVKKGPGLAGCSIYPENAWSMLQGAMGDRSKAWDVACGNITEEAGTVTRLITHVWGQKNLPPTFKAFKTRHDQPQCKSIDSIPKMCVLFHRCKDGSLIDLLRSATLGIPQPSDKHQQEVLEGCELTVVITSYERPMHLRKAFDSCLRAGVTNIVVAATGNPASMRDVFADIKRTLPSVVVLEDGNATSNQSWLHGVETASTKYVTILHDDDLLLPEYLSLVSHGILESAPFIMVQAANHGVPNYTEKDSNTDGWESSSVIRPRLEKKGNLAISPLRGVFLKNDLAQWLRECESMPKSCYLRTGFLVGNDLAIWLNAIEKYPHFFNIPKPAVSFGHWEGSTTVHSLGKNSRELFRIYDETRIWFSALKVLPLNILTIVLDGMPFIAQHLAVFNRLNIHWQWHIVEGAASNTHCTKWCKPQSGRLSKDGTTEYLNQISAHPRVHVHRKPLWDGKIEMCNAPLNTIKEECVLLEVDCDEFWTAEQIESMLLLFQSNPTKTHAMFWCRYFFGPHLVMESRNCYGNTACQDWKRAWRFNPGDKFVSHEPPHLSSESDALMHEATEAAGLVFDHYGYAQRSQVQYKEGFYGYKDAVKHWDKLQQVRTGERKLSDFLPWVNPSISGTVKAIA